MGVLCGCSFEDWLGVLCGRGGHAFFETLLHALYDGGDISLRISMDRRSAWVFHGLKSWFETMNFFFGLFLLFLRLLFFFRRCSTILIMDNSELCCMSVQSLARFMGNFNFEM